MVMLRYLPKDVNGFGVVKVRHAREILTPPNQCDRGRNALGILG